MNLNLDLDAVGVFNGVASRRHNQIAVLKGCVGQAMAELIQHRLLQIPAEQLVLPSEKGRRMRL